MSFLIWTYVIYTLTAVGLTAVLARTLYNNGSIFLQGVFADNEALARATNSLLVIGFYMLNLGYAFMIFRTNGGAESTLVATETLITKLGTLLLSLGVIHFVNMTVFWKIKKSGDKRYLPMPPPPAAATMPPPPPAATFSGAR